MDLGLSDRVYVVTGASRGLGRACAEQLAAEGARLVLSDPDASVTAVASSLGGPERAIAIPGDLTQPGLETCLVAAAMARYGRLDGALVGPVESAAGTAVQTDDGAWRLAFEEVVLGPLRLARTVAGFASHEGGSIVLVLSTTVREPIAGQVLANGLAPALAMTMKTLADELGPRSVRVNAILPGLVHGGRGRHADPTGSDDDRTPYDSPVPLQRAGEPHELARPAVFLLSPAASYVTGALLPVDGGLLRQP